LTGSGDACLRDGRMGNERATRERLAAIFGIYLKAISSEPSTVQSLDIAK
jgi:hypothetical protein